jgi:hypothetical protein
LTFDFQTKILKRLHTTTHVIPITAITFAIAILASGCSQKVAPVITQKTLPTTITDWTQPGFANPINPYDSIGLLHNEALNYAVASRAQWSTDTLYPSCDSLIIDFIDSVWGLPHDSLLWYARFGATHEDSLITVWSTSSEFGPLSIAYVTHLDSILAAGYSDSIAIDSIEAVEAATDTTLSGNAQIVVFCAAAIARYSLSYWTSSDTISWEGWSHNGQRAVVNNVGFRKSSLVPLGIFGGNWFQNDLRGAYTGYTLWDGGWGFPGPGQEIGIGVTLVTAGLLSAFGS